MPQLLYNGRYDAKNHPHSLDEIIDYFIDNDYPEGFWLVVPTGRMVERAKKVFYRKYFDKYKRPCSRPNVFTLQKFAELCYYKLFSGHTGRIISQAYFMTLIEEAAENSELQFFVQNTKQLSFHLVSRIGNLIYGLKEDGIRPDDLLDDIDKYDPDARIDSSRGGIKEPRRLKDIAEIFQNYNELLGDDLLDSPQVLINLNNRLKKIISESSADDNSLKSFFPSRRQIDNFQLDEIFNESSILLFDGFSEFKIPEIEFISSFAVSKIPVAINLDYNEFNGPLFGNLVETAQRLSNAGFNSKTVIDSDIPKNDEGELQLAASQYIRRRLFNSEKEIRNEIFDKSIKIIAAENIIDEVRSIAKLVHHLVKIDNIKPSDICVCMKKPDKYSPLFREIFTLNNIPSYISDRYNLSYSQIITSILTVAEVVVNGYRRSDTIKMLQSSYLNFSAEMDIDCANLSYVARKLRIFAGVRRSGEKSWTTPLKRKLDFSQNQYDNVSSTSDDESEIKRAESQLQSIKKAKEDFDKILTVLEFKNALYTPDEIAHIFKELIINKLGVKQAIVNYYNQIKAKKQDISPIEYHRLIEEIEKDAAALNKFVELLDEMLSIANERSESKKIKLDDFLSKLKIAVSNEKYQVKEKGDRGIKITSIEQTRGIPYKVMILCGAVDGEFPMIYRADSMLGKILPQSEHRHNEAEKIAFYWFLNNNPQLLDSGNQQIYIFYPEFYEKEENVPSTFIGALCKISTLNLESELPEGYYSKWYKLSDMRKRLRNDAADYSFIMQKKDLPWLEYITEKSELLKHYSSGHIALPECIDPSLEQNINYIDSIDNLMENISGEQNVYADKLNEEAQIKLTKLADKTFSISEIEDYVGCPNKYFIKRVLNIDERVDETAEITPLERGDVLHRIVYKFFVELKKSQNDENPLSLVRLHPDSKEEYRALLRQIAELELENIDYANMYSYLEKLAMLGDDNRQGILDFWLDNEIARHQLQNQLFFPSLFEYSFGMGGQTDGKPNKPIQLSNNAKIRGKIDRIEFDNQMNYFLIADYKTNLKNLPSIAAIEKGEKFQIPIYLAAAQSFLEQNYNLTDISPAGGIYYSFNPMVNEKDTSKVATQKYVMALRDLTVIDEDFNPKRDKDKNLINSNEYLQDMIEKSLDMFKEKIDNISSGMFGLKISQGCQFCNFESLCRRNDTKTALMQIKNEETANEEN